MKDWGEYYLAWAMHYWCRFLREWKEQNYWASKVNSVLLQEVLSVR